MAIRPECITAVERALGRRLNAKEAQNLEDRLRRAYRTLSRKEPEAWLRTGQAERLRQAGQLAAADLVKEAELVQRRKALTVLAMERAGSYLEAQAARGVDRVDSVSRLLAPKLDGKDNVQSIETRATAIKREAFAQLSQEIETLGPRFLGLMENDAGAIALIRELKGEDSGVATARTFAQKWKAITEGLRERFNAAGGKIRFLEDWGFPQHHSQGLVAKAGIEEWVRFVTPLLDRSRYFDDAGRPMGDEQFRKTVETAWRSIATGGLLDAEPGARFRGMIANRHAAARELHFKSAEAYLQYHGRFAEKSVMASLVDHIDGLSRDLALVEVLGPNPEHAFAVLLDHARQAEAQANPRKTGAIERAALGAERLYNEVAGLHPPVGSIGLAKGFDTLRNWMVASRLGSAVITSFSDEATLYLTARLNNLPEMQIFRNEFALMNPANVADRRLLRRAGLGLDTMIGSINRAGQEHFMSGASQRVATFVLRASGLNFLTDARSQAFGATMMDALGSLTRRVQSLKGLEATDHRILLSKGITETDWQVWRRAQPEDWGAGNGLLTVEAIRRVPDEALRDFGDPATVRREAALKLLGVISEETDIAVIKPGARERALMGAGLQRGSWKGELTRSFFLFKSFPIAMVMKHWRRALEMEGATGTATYLASLIASTTVLGMASLQVNEVLSGKDPKNMNPFEGENALKNWGAAMLKGGSLGLYGDFLFSQQSQGERGAVASLLGPVIGLGEEAIGLTQGNLIQAAQGEDTRFGGEAVRLVKGLTPGGNLWYTKAALDHLIFHQLQDLASPGYLNRMERRARREFGQEFWWTPGEAMPSRAPNLQRAVGEE